MPKTIIILYLVAMNLALLILMGIDKYRAKHFRWRTKESTLMRMAALGGAMGGCIGMLLFRHKTRHRSFLTAFPLFLILQILCLALCVHFNLII